MLKISVSRASGKFIEKLPPKHAKQIVLKIRDLARDPRPPDSKRLKGKHSAFRRADVGEYRIIYRVEDGLLQVYLVGKRNDAAVYRILSRKPAR